MSWLRAFSKKQTKNANVEETGQSIPVDPNFPRWLYQKCRRCPLCFVGVDSYVENFFNDPSRSGMQGQDSSMSQGASVQPDTGPLKAMGESFVAVYKSESSLYGGGTNLPPPDSGPSGPVQPNISEFQPTVTALKHAFEIATNHIQVELPVCLDCMRVLYRDLHEMFKEVNMDIEAYGACLKRLERKTWNILSEGDFLKEKLKIEEEEQKLEAEIGEMEKRNAEINDLPNELEMIYNRFKELEERAGKIIIIMFKGFSNCHLNEASIYSMEKRDAFLAKIEVSQARLELLKRINLMMHFQSGMMENLEQ